MTDDRLNRVLATGVTEAEIAEAAAVDLDMHDYAAARTAGATHAEVLEVGALGYDGLVEYYTSLRGAEGATHAEAMAAVRATATLLATRHESTVADAERLAVLAEHEDSIVRLCVADNPSAPPEALARLSRRRETRLPVAGNPSTPPEVLTRLSGHKAWTVRKAVLRNPSTPPEVLAAHEQHEADYWAARGAAPEPPPLPEADQLQM